MNIKSDFTAGYMTTGNRVFIKQEAFVFSRMANVPRMQVRPYIILYEIVFFCKEGVAERQSYCINTRKGLKIPITHEESCISKYRNSYVEDLIHIAGMPCVKAIFFIEHGNRQSIYIRKVTVLASN